MATLKRYSDKPRIMFYRNEWTCVGNGKFAVGKSPKKAYFAWEKYLPPARNDFGIRY